MCRGRDDTQTHSNPVITYVCVCVLVVLTLFFSAVPDFLSLAIKRYQLWLSLISTSTWQSPIHICQRQWAESNRSPIIHREPCKALETVGLNRAHTESHRDTCTNAEAHIKKHTYLTEEPHTFHFTPSERFDRT